MLPADIQLRLLFASVKTIAIIGAREIPGQPVDRVGRYLLQCGYTVFPVHPGRKTVWGLRAVSELAELETPMDLVLLFRSSRFCAEHARQVLALPARPLCFWMQEGISSPEAAALLEPKGILVVEDHCIMVEHARVLGPQGESAASREGVEENLSRTPARALSLEAPVDDSTVFTCQMCGQCCRGQGGIVVSPRDLERITRSLDLEAGEFVRRYGEWRGGKLQIRTGTDGACIFFHEGQGCSVHAGKPDVCRAWPFFRGNILDAGSFAMAKEYCPGIHKGVSHADFARAGRNYLKRHQLLARDGQTEGWAVILDD